MNRGRPRAELTEGKERGQAESPSWSQAVYDTVQEREKENPVSQVPSDNILPLPAGN